MKRGFSRMLWGGIILLVVLFFVSVYGVKEGFANQCVEGQTYSEPTFSSDGKYLTGCYDAKCQLLGNQDGNKKFTCYSGSLNKNNNLTYKKDYRIKDGQILTG